jgi:cytoplasmic tRNA 2-thiolation protein 2
MKEIVTPYDIPLIISPIEDVFSISLDDKETNNNILNIISDGNKKEFTINQNTNIDNKTALKELFDATPLLADKECLLNNLRLVLLNYMAKKNSYPVLCLGDSSTKAAIDVISYTCKGRGSSIPLDVGNESVLIDGVVMIKPGKTLLRQEFIQYNKYLNLESIPDKELDDISKSIDLISESFISDLQKNFPSTVTTVVSTANKLSMDNENYKEYNCSMFMSNKKRF